MATPIERKGKAAQHGCACRYIGAGRSTSIVPTPQYVKLDHRYHHAEPKIFSPHSGLPGSEGSVTHPQHLDPSCAGAADDMSLAVAGSGK